MLKKRSRPRKNSRNKENKMTLSRFSKIVYEHKVTTVTNGQARKYKSYTGELIKFFGDIELEDIELADAYQFVNYLKYEKRQYEGVKQRENWNKIGLKSSSVNDYIVTLSSAINLMYDLEYLNEDNFKNVFSKVKKLKEDKAKPRQVPADDLKQFLKVLYTQYYTDLRMKTVVYALLESYCRVNELCNLKIDDIDFQTGLITLYKTKNSNFRVVPVSKKVLRMLKFLIKENEIFNTEYIFTTVRGSKISENSLRRSVREVSKRAGLTRNITPHQIRHAGAVESIRNGIDIRSLQKMLGHSKIETTTIYLNIHDESLIEAQSKYSPLSILENKSNLPSTTKARRRRL